MNFIDLERRFHALTDAELEDLEALVSRSEHPFGSDIGWPDLLDYSRVILLAEAGAGKTVEMREQAKRLVKDGKFAFFVALESLDHESVGECLSPEEEGRFEAWKENPEALAWFFLDAVDEWKLTQGKLDPALRRLSRDLNGHLHHTRIILSCRPSDWRPELDLATVRNRLPAPEKAGEVPSLPPDEVFVSAVRREHATANPVQDDLPDREAVQTVIMLPMNRTQIERFAKQSGVNDAPAFLKEITRQNARTFADRPLDLADLIRIWMSSGHLGTRAQQHETNVTSKLRDGHDLERPDSNALCDAQARLGAERLALALFLTRTRTIQSSEQVPDIHRSDSALDPARILSDWTEAQRQALLRRALFDPATYGRVRFHHRSIQEYLAARRLKALRDRGMPTKALFRLLFAERYGVEVVFPSMRAIAAWLSLWDDGVREELIRREPEALLSLGDPETIDIAGRGKFVKAFFKAYGEGGWRGLNIPITEVRRLSHPDLAPVIRECWGNGPTNDDVRKLLIEMIWQGAVEDCADLAHDVAVGPTENPYHRIVAIRALVACCHERARKIADAILAQPESWPDRVVHGVAADLFPAIITVDELVGLMERTREPEQIVGGFGRASQQIADDVEPWSKAAIDLRNEMADLVRRGGRCGGKYRHHCWSKFNYLTPALAILCRRQLSGAPEEPSDDLIQASVTASRFGKEGWRNPIGELRKLFHDNAALRSCAFWAELTLMDEVVPAAGGDHHRLLNTIHGGLVGHLTEADRHWLLGALTDKESATRRPVALHALIRIWIQHGRIASELDIVRAPLKDDVVLGEILERYVEPPGRNTKFKQEEREHQKEKCDQEIREAQRLRDWMDWRETLLSEPDDAFSTERRGDTVLCIYDWLHNLKRGSDPSDRINVWDKDALIQAFDRGIADRAEKAFRALWRTKQPVLWSARPNEAKNSIQDWILGLSGVSAEATAQGWASSLSPEEIRTATAYATIERSGFAPFIEDLAKSYSVEIEKLIGDEIDAELEIGNDHDHLPILQDLAYMDRTNDLSFKQLFVPRLLAALRSIPNTFTIEKPSRWERHLGEILKILADANTRSDREAVARECAIHYSSDPSGSLALVWLKGLFSFNPGQGAQALVDTLSDHNDPGTCNRAVNTFAALFGGPDSVRLEVSDPAQLACLLGQLVRCAYTFIRPEDDQVHEGIFSPDTRDNAQRARNFLLSRLLDTPGPEARRTVLTLADENDFGKLQDYLRLCARQRTAADAEFEPFSPEAVIDLERRHEIPPNDGNSLFAVMMDRLEDLAHDLAHDDFSDRRTVQNITKEPEMQRTIARRLNEKKNGAYTVTREEEVADGKYPDIRLSAIGIDHRVAIEVKIADNDWSLTDLEQALRSQLVGQYLRHSNCKGGCLLLTYHGRKCYWIHPDTNARLTFLEIVQFLKDKAQTIEREDLRDIRIAVFGLDLTDPSPALARRGNLR